MNYLAHLYLSGDNEHIMLGNFIADHIKGNKIQRYSVDVKKGIELHRKIDFYTDHNVHFMQTRDRLHTNYHKYAGVIADILYDHFLASNWNQYSNQNLSDYVSYSYGILMRNYTILPSTTKKLLPFFIMQNWLVNYKSFDGLQRVFELMSRRAKFKSNMKNVVEEFKVDYELYKEEFLLFFPQIQEHVKNSMPDLKGEI